MMKQSSSKSGGIHLTRETSVPALTSWLKQQLLVFDGETVSNQDAITSFCTAFAHIDSGLSSEIAICGDIASNSKEIAEADHESLLALLTSVALELSRLVDLQKDPSAKMDHITNSTDWLKRSLETMLPSTEVANDNQIARKLLDVVKDVDTSLKKRRGIIDELKVKKGMRAWKAVTFYREVEHQEMKMRQQLMLHIKETQMRTFEKKEFVETMNKL
nr:hypothetical protein [Tanacetum cinerariifolium]